MLETNVKIITLDTTEKVLKDSGTLNTTFQDSADFKIPAEMFKSWDPERRLELLRRIVDLLKVLGLMRATCPNHLGLQVEGTLVPVRLHGTNLAVAFVPDLVNLESDQKSIADPAFQARLIFAYNSNGYEQQEATAIASVPSALWTANAHPAVIAYRFYRDYPVPGVFAEMLLEFGQYHGFDNGGTQLIPQRTEALFKYRLEMIGDKKVIVYGPTENPWLLKRGPVGQWRVYRYTTMALVTDVAGFGMAMEDLRKVCSTVATLSAHDKGVHL